MGVYIDGLDIPKPIKDIKTCYDIIIQSDGAVSEFDSDDRHEYKAEEIDLVRCKDCKQYLQDDGKPYCDIWMREVEDNGFCSYGERK